MNDRELAKFIEHEKTKPRGENTGPWALTLVASLLGMAIFTRCGMLSSKEQAELNEQFNKGLFALKKEQEANILKFKTVEENNKKYDPTGPIVPGRDFTFSFSNKPFKDALYSDQVLRGPVFKAAYKLPLPESVNSKEDIKFIYTERAKSWLKSGNELKVTWDKTSKEIMNEIGIGAPVPVNRQVKSLTP